MAEKTLTVPASNDETTGAKGHPRGCGMIPGVVRARRTRREHARMCGCLWAGAHRACGHGGKHGEAGLQQHCELQHECRPRDTVLVQGREQGVVEVQGRGDRCQNRTTKQPNNTLLAGAPGARRLHSQATPTGRDWQQGRVEMSCGSPSVHRT